MPQHKLSHILASRIASIAHLERMGGECHIPVIERHQDEIERLVKAYMPSGSGFDNGTQIDFDKSTEEKLVFHIGFHHMDDNGSYDGWTNHVVTVTASFTSPNIKISGRDRNGIKDYIADCFLPVLAELITEEWDNEAKEFTFYNKHDWKA